MSRLRKIAEIPAGSWTRWLVVGLWLVVVAVAYPLQSKLMGAEKNDTSAWLAGQRRVGEDPGRRPVDVVAQQAGPYTRPGTSRTRPGAHRRAGR